MGLTPLFLIAVVSEQPVVALAVFALAGLTDGLDGFIARHYGQQSQLGVYLDPVADKLMLMSAYVVLAVPGLHRGVLIPAWVTVLVIARDLLIITVALVLRLALGKGFRPPTVLSKVNTTVQVVTAIAVLASAVWPALSPAVVWLPYLVAATTVASGISYILMVPGLVAAERREGPPPGAAPPG
jgi:cardiolipin synthase